jgi:hypothetical protein
VSSNFEFLHSLANAFTAIVPFFLKVAAAFCQVYAFLAWLSVHTYGFNGHQTFRVFEGVGNGTIHSRFA